MTQYLLSLSELYQAIDNGMQGRKFFCEDLLRNILSLYRGKDWKNHSVFSEHHYTRIPLYQNSQFEILLSCWNPGQNSSLHDHPPNGCMMKIITGSLTEKLYKLKPLQYLRTSILTENAIYYINHEHGHAVCNATKMQTVSLHIYSPPNYEPHYLDSSQSVNYESV